jgi:hypothetical protein
MGRHGGLLSRSGPNVWLNMVIGVEGLRSGILRIRNFGVRLRREDWSVLQNMLPRPSRLTLPTIARWARFNASSSHVAYVLLLIAFFAVEL